MSRRILIVSENGFPADNIATHWINSGHQIQQCTLAEMLIEGDQQTDVFDSVVYCPTVGPMRDKLALVEQSMGLIAVLAKMHVNRIFLLGSIASGLATRGQDYGSIQSKIEDVFAKGIGAEQALVIIRKPAVYGPGMDGPLRALVALVAKGLPLPFGHAKGLRPYVSIENLCDLLDRLIAAQPSQWQALSGKSFTCRDDAMMHTRDLVSHIGVALERPVRLLSVPQGMVRLAGRMIGKNALVSSVFDPVPCPLSPELETVLGWRPVHEMPQSLAFLKDA